MTFEEFKRRFYQLYGFVHPVDDEELLRLFLSAVVVADWNHEKQREQKRRQRSAAAQR